MNIPTEIASHIEIRAEAKAKNHAKTIIGALAQEVQKGDVTVTAGGANTVINSSFLDSLETALISNSRDRFQQEELEVFLKAADGLTKKRPERDQSGKLATPEPK